MTNDTGLVERLRLPFFIGDDQRPVALLQDSLRKANQEREKAASRIEALEAELNGLEAVILNMANGVSPPGAPFECLGDPDDEIDTLAEYVNRRRATRSQPVEGDG